MLNNISNTQLLPRQLGCSEHGGYLSSGQSIKLGSIQREIWSGCPKCKSLESTQAHLASAELSAQAQQARLAVLLQQAAIPKRFLASSFDSYCAETPDQKRVLVTCRRYVDNFERHLARGTGLVLAGKMGTGKSHLAASILQEIMPTHVGAYTTMMDLVHLLREGWGGGASKSEAKVLAEIGRLPLLVIDEIGVQFGSAAEQVHLFEVLDRRYRDMKPTILLTNQDRAGFNVFIGERIADRLTETASWVEFNWLSYRLVARKVLA